MSKNLIRHAALLVAAVLLSAGFWSCGKEDIPEPIPPTVAVTGVTLDKTSISLLVGDSETLTATVTPADAENQKLTWSSDKPAVATVDDNGKVTAVKAGEATITVTTQDGGKTATCRVTVSDREIKVTGVTLNKSTLSLIEGGSETLTATITPADATNQNVAWTSSDATVATVDDRHRRHRRRQRQGNRCQGRRGHRHRHHPGRRQDRHLPGDRQRPGDKGYRCDARHDQYGARRG